MKAIILSIAILCISCSKEYSYEKPSLVQAVFSRKDSVYQLVLNRPIADTAYAVLVGRIPVRILLLAPNDLQRSFTTADTLPAYRLAGISTRSGNYQFRIINQ